MFPHRLTRGFPWGYQAVCPANSRNGRREAPVLCIPPDPGHVSCCRQRAVMSVPHDTGRDTARTHHVHHAGNAERPSLDRRCRSYRAGCCDRCGMRAACMRWNDGGRSVATLSCRDRQTLSGEASRLAVTRRSARRARYLSGRCRAANTRRDGGGRSRPMRHHDRRGDLRQPRRDRGRTERGRVAAARNVGVQRIRRVPRTVRLLCG